MKHKILPSLLLALMIASITGAATSIARGTQKPFVGTYQLIARELPDGTKLGAPQIMGLLTITERYINVNMVWQDENGKHASYSAISEYKLTPTEYTETMLFSVRNDEISSQPTSYDLVGKTKAVPVTMDGSKIKFDPPFSPVSLVFDENWITTKVQGEYTHYWERVP